MEKLVDALGLVLETSLGSPFDCECICVQSRGMKQYISLELSQKFGICANTRFLFPKQFISQILSLASEREGSFDRVETDEIFWRVMRQFSQTENNRLLAPLFEYFNSDSTGKKKYQLAMKIAALFDGYQVYRPDMVTHWQNHLLSNLKSEPSLTWQAVLWHIITHSGLQNNIANLSSHFFATDLMQLKEQKRLPERISLFGITALPPLFMQIFDRLGKFIDIHLFLMVPSDQFFFDLPSDRQVKKQALKPRNQKQNQPLGSTDTNPLLTNMGNTAKYFLNLLESYDYHEPVLDLFYNPADDISCMLSIVQSDILNLVCRKKQTDHLPCKIDLNDTSISIHSCHSPMREAQVLKDLLFSELHKDPDLSLHDIIVMMPDIESYAPFIESVFSLENTLGFSISDRKKRSQSETVMAFLKILGLNNERLEKKQVLELLLSPTIAARFSIDPQEIQVIEKMVHDAHILWGEDGSHRQSFGLPDIQENTWQFGLQRLFVGMAMPEDASWLVQGVSPCQTHEGLELSVLGKFSSFCHALFSILRKFKQDHTVKQWSHIFNQTVHTLIVQNKDNTADISFLTQSILSLKEGACAAEFNDKISFDVAFASIQDKLDENLSQGNFRAGLITFCNLMPMRSIPYKIVALMGMDEASFPRKQIASGFDLIAKHPRPGDKNHRDDDRYLFLETLLSARSKFMITYTGMSVQDNSMIPASGVVSELCDTLNQSFIFDDAYSYLTSHPLHPYDSKYFTQNSPLFSYSANNCNIAKALEANTEDNFKPGFYDLSFQKTDIKVHSELALSQIIRFFKNPMSAFMRDCLGIRIPDVEDSSLDRETFSITGLEQYFLGQSLISQEDVNTDKNDTYIQLNAQGILPYGEKGRLEYLRVRSKASALIELNNKILQQKVLPSVPVQATIHHQTISSSLFQIHENGRYILGFGKINGTRLLSAWIEHLFLNITAPDNYPKTTFVAGQDAEGRRPVFLCSFSPVDTGAKKIFSSLLELFNTGMQQPLFFFCQTAWQIIKVLEKNNFDMGRKTIVAAMNKAQPFWHGNAYMQGESQDRYVAYCLDGKDPFDSVQTFVFCGLIENALTVFRPMLDHMEVL